MGGHGGPYILYRGNDKSCDKFTLNKKKWPLLMKKCAYDPKNTKIRFLGSNARFFTSYTHFFSFEWIHHRIWTSLDYFRPVWIKHNHFETISGQFGIFSDIFFNYFEWFWITSQHIRDWPRLFLTIPVGMTALNQLFNAVLTFFGVKCPFFHAWHPLFFLLIKSSLDFPFP